MRRPWNAETLYVTTSDEVRLAIHRIRPFRGEIGSAPAVMLLHGLGANRFAFHFPGRSMAEWLAARGFDCYVPELRGAGMSGSRHRRWDLDDYVQSDLPAILRGIREASGRDRVHWVGHSMGGILLLCYALQHGEAEIATGCAMGSALDYTAGKSGFRRLLGLRALIRGIEQIPFGATTRLLAPLLGYLDTPLERFNFCRENIEPSVVRAVHASGFGPIPQTLLLSLATTFEPGGLCSRDQSIRYLECARELRLPLMLIAGSRDAQCPIEAVDATAAAMGREVVLHRFGRAFGHRVDYGHFDLVLGRNAPDEVWPEIERWLGGGPWRSGTSRERPA